jgi:hypothetical protein
MPKPFEGLTRQQIVARIATLRQALDAVAAQAEQDGGPAFACYGRMKVTMFHYRQHLRAMDRAVEAQK